MGECVGGQPRAKLSHTSKDAQENFASFDVSAVIGSRWGIMVSIKKPPKTYTFCGLKLRGLTQNQIITLDFISQNFQRKKLYTLGNFDDEIPTHIGATHAILKSKRKFQNRIPRELNQSFGIPKISVFH